MPYGDSDRQRRYQNEWIKRRRLDWLEANGPCVDCGTWDELQVDHVDAGQKVSHRVWSWKKERREAELAKCVVRCEPCHRTKTTENRERAHGERNGNARLTEREVREIRVSTLPKRQLGRVYGVSDHTIRMIKLRTLWKYVE
jgi:hypothetical protein